MIDVVRAILRQNSRFLLAQRSILDRAGGTWTFPGGEVGPEDIDTIAAVHRELKEEVGLQGSRFLKMFHVCLNQYRVQIFYAIHGAENLNHHVIILLELGGLPA